MRRYNRYFYILGLLFLWLMGINAFISAETDTGLGQAQDAAHLERLETVVRSHPGDLKARIQLAQLAYTQSGLAAHLATRSLLWAENNCRSDSLRKKLPPVNAALVSVCQYQLLQILERDPDNLTALLMAGNCQLFAEQKRSALWYFNQALANASDTRACLALADYYLQEWQPVDALRVLQNGTGPEIDLRKGAAYLELDDYPMAYGFLLKANPLPQTYQWTRDKDLFKAALAMDEKERVLEYAKYALPSEPIAATLFQELKGWSEWQEGNAKEAFQLWNSGRTINPDYWFWEGAVYYLSGTSEAPNRFPKGWGDHYLDSNLRLVQGDVYLKQGLDAQAYQSYLTGIKADHRSLIGFLKAGGVKLKTKAYAKAIDLFSQALAVNPGFAPILLERAVAYQRSGHGDLAAMDRRAAGLALTGLAVQAIQAELVHHDPNTVELILKGATRNLTGLWLNDGKTDWKWVPWWGGDNPP